MEEEVEVEEEVENDREHELLLVEVDEDDEELVLEVLELEREDELDERVGFGLGGLRANIFILLPKTNRQHCRQQYRLCIDAKCG